jgi:monoamine oxidase
VRRGCAGGTQPAASRPEAVNRPGQWFTIRPALQQPQGQVLSAGEHLAEWQGFMEGAVNTGD